MKKRMLRRRLFFAACTAVVFLIELCIALFVHDSFIRPYFGDVLVVILLWCAVKVVFPRDSYLPTPLIFCFACAVEFSQMIPLVDLIGLGDNLFFVTVMGRSFSWLDILCYGSGCLFLFGMESLVRFSRGKDCPIFAWY